MDFLKLRATLGLDSSEYESGLNKAKGLAGTIGGGIKTALNVGIKAVTAATTAVTAFTAASVATGSDFDKSMSQVAATMGKTMTELKDEIGSVDTVWGEFDGNLREYAQFLGKNTAFSATQAADALNYMALAGYDAQTSMRMLPNVLNLAAAGSMDLATASDMVTDTQTAFGISLDRTSQMVDEMAKAASTGNTSVSQLGEAFLTVGGLAQELNGGLVTLGDGTTASVDGIQELEIALTAMANAGIKGSEAGTHMRNMLLKLASPTSDGTKALEAMGVTVFDTAGNMRSLSDVFGDLNSKLSEMTQEEKIQTISDLFNTRDLASAEALLNAVGQDWDKIGESILNSKDAAAKMADTQLDNLAGDITLMKSALEGFQIAISDGATPKLREFVQLGTRGLSDLTTIFSKFDASPYLDEMGRMTQEGAMAQAEFQKNRKAAIDDLFGSVTDGVNLIAESIPELVDGGIKLLGAIGKGIIDNLPVLTDAAVRVVTQLSLGLVQALPALATGVATLVQSLSKSFSENAETFKEAGLTILEMLWNGLVEGIPQAANIAVELIENFGNFITENLPLIAEKGGELITFFAEGITTVLPALLSTAVDVMISLAEAFTSPDFLTNIIQAGLNIVLTLAQSLLDNLPKLIQAIPVIFQNLVTAIVENLPAIIEAGIQIIGALLQAFIENVPLLIAAAYDMVFALVNGLIEAMPSLIVAGYQLVTELINTFIRSLPKFLDNGLKIVQSIITGITNMYSAIIKSGIDLVTKFIQAIKDRFTSLVETGKEMINTIKNGIKEKIDDAKTWGQDLIENFINGIKEKWEALKSTVSDVAASIKSFLGFSEPEKGPLSNFHTYAPDMMDLFMQGIEDNKSKLLDTVANAFNFKDLIVSPTVTPTVMADGGEGAISGGFTQINNIYSPEELSPSEVARQTKNATRDMLLELRGF